VSEWGSLGAAPRPSNSSKLTTYITINFFAAFLAGSLEASQERVPGGRAALRPARDTAAWIPKFERPTVRIEVQIRASCAWACL
jgi:hypothetical protein